MQHCHLHVYVSDFYIVLVQFGIANTTRTTSFTLCKSSCLTKNDSSSFELQLVFVVKAFFSVMMNLATASWPESIPSKAHWLILIKVLLEANVF